ncbi:MAG: protein kinase [Methylococcaceae bacterium]|nr:protein kinase [Methylococcaceae bacterium]
MSNHNPLLDNLSDDDDDDDATCLLPQGGLANPLIPPTEQEPTTSPPPSPAATDEDDDSTCLLPPSAAVNPAIHPTEKNTQSQKSPAQEIPIEDDDATCLLPQAGVVTPPTSPRKAKSQPQNTSANTNDTANISDLEKINLANQNNSENFENDFTIQGIIGEGGVGRVYLAEDESIGRRVAVKELLDTNLSEKDQKALENSFIHEAKITAKLEHPGIIPIYKLGQRDGKKPYYVMRHVKGETLEELLKKCHHSIPEIATKERLKLLDNLIAACDAIAYAHSKSVIHRDLKPSNIINGKFGETIILDWGLAQAMDDGDNTYFFQNIQSHQTDTYSDVTSHSGMGTPRYMAPEQLKGHATKASDVYSLGVVLFRIITGDMPYKGSLQQIQEQLLSETPSPSPNQYIGTISPELGAICEKAMAKNTADRFVDAGQLAQQLKDYRDGRMVDIYSYSKQELLRRFLAKNKLMVFMIAALFIAIAAGGAFSVHYAMKMDEARAKAEEALISVTALGEKAQEQATEIAGVFSDSIDELFVDMKKTTSQLDAFTRENLEAENKLLATLQRQYPKFSSFTLENSEAIPATLGWKAGTHKFDAPIAYIENKRLILTFLVPLKKQGKKERYLTAKVFPEKVFPSFFPIEVDTKHPKDIWLMQDDGLIVYDAETKYQATNVFIDTINTQSASLVAFGKQTLENPYGISYYSFMNEGKKIFKIAAWHTVDFPQAKSWKVIVNYTYMRTEAD